MEKKPSGDNWLLRIILIILVSPFIISFVSVIAIAIIKALGNSYHPH